MKKIVILGSTGSIGTQTLDIVSKNEDLTGVGISARQNISMLGRADSPLSAATCSRG